MVEKDTKSSRMPGWYKLSPPERGRQLAAWLSESPDGLLPIMQRGGLSVGEADRLIENVVGVHALPFAVAPNFVVNGRQLLVPMVIEEPSVVAAAANAARIVRAGGGFRVSDSGPLMICQIQLFTSDVENARLKILEAKPELLSDAAVCDPVLAELGGGPVDIEVRSLYDKRDGGGRPAEFVVVHLLVSVLDAMGANTVNTMGEAIVPRLEALCRGRAGLKILTNLADHRTVSAAADIPATALEMNGFDAQQVCDGIASASTFAELDPYRAATHNKGIMNGVDALMLATGNDWRAVEAGAHAYAASSGGYKPLCVWRRGQDGELQGRLKMPMAVGIVGGATRLHACARLALRIMGVESAGELARIAAAVGMASNLAALRALATEGIQKGHMRLHRRSQSASQSGRD